MSENSDYNRYEQLDSLSYNCIAELMHNENIWKLLYYMNPEVLIDPTTYPNLTSVQKRNLIYRGQSEDASDYRVFFTGGNNDDAFVERVCLLRVYPLMVNPDNHIVGTVSIVFECLSHYKVDTICNTDVPYSARSLTVIKEIVKSLNNKDVGGLGTIFFSKKQGYNNKIQYELFTNKGFSGYSIIMSAKMGASGD